MLVRNSCTTAERDLFSVASRSICGTSASGRVARAVVLEVISTSTVSVVIVS
jgi:hypothetical protein